MGFTMSARLRVALVLLVSVLAGCELCDHLECPQNQTCEAAFQVVCCDIDGDGNGDKPADLDAAPFCGPSSAATSSCGGV